MEVTYEFLSDKMTVAEIKEEKEFLKLHNWTGKSNLGLDFKTFVKSVNPYYLMSCSPTLFKLFGGAKGIGKTTFQIMKKIFFMCNFTDVNCEFWRYFQNHSYEQLSTTFYKACTIFDSNGSTIFEAIDAKALKISDSKSQSDFTVKWPNGRVLKCGGYDNTESWSGKDGQKTGAELITTFDEIVPVDYSEKPILDEAKWTETFSQFIQQKIRSQGIETFDRKLKMWTVIINIKNKNVETKFEFCLTKNYEFQMNFNNHDNQINRHPAKTLFLGENYVIDKNKLLNEFVIINNDLKDAEGMGITVFFASFEINKYNLTNLMDKFANFLKKRVPEIYEKIIIGLDQQYSNEKYVYKKSIELANNTNKLFDVSISKFDDILFGGDYADSVRGKDDAVWVMLGIKFKDGIFDTVTVLDELIISSKEFFDQVKKLNLVKEWIKFKWKALLKFNPKYYSKLKIKLRMGQDSRTIVHIIHDYLSKDEELLSFTDLANFDTFTATGRNIKTGKTSRKVWTIVERENTVKQLFSLGKIRFLNKESYLLRDFNHVIKDDKTSIRNEKPGINKLDTINAFEYALSKYRNYLL